ncbi:MAG: Na+/H+ antiporter subunit E [Oscillospiraceae bacterium]|nr:Na+/H+ antiporter subunit E [Oscillospiraceae bacterium]
MRFSRKVLGVFSLAVIWIVLRENFSLFDVALGVGAGIACLFFANRFLPAEPSEEIKLSRLITYPFWLVGQIYLSGFFVIKMIVLGARADIVHFNTRLNSNVLKVIMGNSITLVPGSITLDYHDSEYTVVWMRAKNASKPKGDSGNAVKGKLEARLIKADCREGE